MGSVHDVGGHCPTCGAEYRPGFETCADDGTPLVPGPAPESAGEPLAAPEAATAPAPDATWIEVTVLGAHEAQLLVGRLESEGIDARTDPPEVAGWPGYPFGGTSQRAVKVLVAEGQAARARAVLRELDRG